MLDSVSKKLLWLIINECESGYKIIEKEFLISSFPQGLVIDEFLLKKHIGYLLEKEYISVKYEDEKELCVCPLPKGKLLLEENLNGEIENYTTKKRYFLFSFLGAFLGGVAVSLLFVVFLVLSGKI